MQNLFRSHSLRLQEISNIPFERLSYGKSSSAQVLKWDLAKKRVSAD